MTNEEVAVAQANQTVLVWEAWFKGKSQRLVTVLGPRGSSQPLDVWTIRVCQGGTRYTLPEHLRLATAQELLSL